jgi:hypothetical protein
MSMAAVGRVVHYVARGSADGMFAPVCRAALVSEVGDDPARVGLAVLNPTGVFFQPLADGGVALDAGQTEAGGGTWVRCAGGGRVYRGGTWHWPEHAASAEVRLPDDVQIEDVARVCHAANQAWRQAIGEKPSPRWDEMPQADRDLVVSGVRAALSGMSDRELHTAWSEARIEAGWVYGPVLDREQKRHPCLVAYDRLPEAQRAKDRLIRAVVTAFATGGAQ